jgi:carboxymethylenebutenolidase
VIKAHAIKIAAHGYRCLVPDLYHGKIGADKEEASHLLSSLDWQRAVGEVTEAVEYLKSTGAAKVGVIGFCMGGALSIAAAQHSGVAAAVPFYGTPSPEIADPALVSAPLQMHFGELDEFKGFSDAATAVEYGAKVNAGVGSAEVFIYEGCGHAFLNEGPEGVAKRDHMGFPHPSKDVQDLAWSRVLGFLEKQLKA